MEGTPIEHLMPLLTFFDNLYDSQASENQLIEKSFVGVNQNSQSCAQKKVSNQKKKGQRIRR